MAIDIQTASKGALRAYSDRFGQERRVARTHRLVDTGAHVASHGVGQDLGGTALDAVEHLADDVRGLVLAAWTPAAMSVSTYPM
jgi:hypothetical protein